MGVKKWTNDTIDEALEPRTIIRITDVTKIKAPSITRVTWRCAVCNHVWLTTVDSIIRGSGCQKCSGNLKLTMEECQTRLDILQRNIQVLGLYNGKQGHERKGLFKCGICNTQWMMILSNLFGKKQGCPRCGKSGRYNDNWFINHEYDRNIRSTLYVILLYNDNEKFIKIGITKRDTKNRLATSIPYLKEILFESETNLYAAYNLEQEIIKTFNQYKYEPRFSFGGKNECFVVDVKHNIITTIKRNLNA